MNVGNLLSDHQIHLFKKNGFVNAGPLISRKFADQLCNEILEIIDRKEYQTYPQPIKITNISNDEKTSIWQIVKFVDICRFLSI